MACKQNRYWKRHNRWHVGILLSGNGNIITGNYIANNKNDAFFGSNQPGNVPSKLVISENCFVDNIQQLGGSIWRKLQHHGG